MKDLFENIKQGAYVGSKILAEKTKQVVEATKKEVDIQKVRYDINKQLRQLGVLTYKVRTGEMEDCEERINGLVEQLKANYAILKELRIKNPEEVKEEADFEVEVEVEAEETEEVSGDEEIKKPEKNEEGYYVMRFCQHCQVGNHPNATHCVHCGKPLN